MSSTNGKATRATSIDLRCNVLHGVLIGDGHIEFKCRSRFCGYQSGVVILHYFDVHTGQLTNTLRFRSPDQVGKT
jgi:hypothetical protein